MVYSIPLLVLSLLGGADAAPSNMARLNGVVAVADSQCRDRWGIDGYHPDCVRDGNRDGSEAGAMTASWASDNWEATHALALVFPRRINADSVKVYWAGSAEEPFTPRRFILQGCLDGRWFTIAEISRDKPESATTIMAGGARMDAIRIFQPPEGASALADRRLRIAEFEVTGSPEKPEIPVDVQRLAGEIRKEFRELREREDSARVAPALAVATKQRKPRGFMGIIDAEDVARGRRNAASRPWAKSLVEAIRKDADWWLAQSDEYICGLLPEGNPRALCPQFEKGCPIHGGARMSFTATLESPYQWRCKHGGELWHDGAIVKNPKTGEETVVRDDGSGWLAPEGFLNPGRRYYFVAAYRYYLIGKLFSSPYEPDGGSKYQGGTPVVQLALAYAATGDRRYAHKCAVMLNRLAELYRGYDGCVEGPSQRQDGYIGQTFERFLVQNLILACDLIWDEIETDEELRAFFSARGSCDYDGDGKTTGADFTFNLQRNLLGFIYEYLHRLMPYMDGDFLMYEMTALGALANCLGNEEIARETLESDLGLRVLLTNSWFRDGKFIYDSCGYNAGNARTPLLTAEWLHGLRTPPGYSEPLDLYHHPEYRMSMLFDFLRRIDCDGRIPQIGDSGGARTSALRAQPPYDPLDERALVRLPEQRDFYLSRLSAAAGSDLESFRFGRADWWLLFHAQDDQTSDAPRPYRLDADIQTSDLFDDSGIAILRAGANPQTRQHVSLTFSKGAYGHGHTDKLAINVMRFGYDLTADLGYPTTWTDVKIGWETGTESHCTVLLNQARQRGNAIGKFNYFAAGPHCDVVEASAEAAYPGVKLYRRTVALARDDAGEPLYTADFFRVAGAASRDYLFHALGKPEDLSITFRGGDVEWVKQERGSLAGENVEPMTQQVCSFLFDVERAQSGDAFTAAWRPAIGASQGDRYLLTRRRFRDFTAEFTVTRTGKASGGQERALFAFGVDPSNENNRRVAWIEGGLPVGQPVRVRIEAAGPQAKIYLDGQPSNRSVDTAGTPPDAGVVGFLHYYNYNYIYSDFVLTPKDGEAIRVDFSKPLDPAFWGRIDATYETSEGRLIASDCESLAVFLHSPGAPGREIIRARAEGYGVRGKSPLEGHLIIRERPKDRDKCSVFASVIEATRGGPRVTAVDAVPVASETGATEMSDVAALRVKSSDPEGGERVDYVISAMNPEIGRVIQDDATSIKFKGRFGLVTIRGGKVGSLSLVGGGHIECGGRKLELLGDIRGEIVEVDAGGDAIRIALPPGAPAPSADMVGRRIIVTNPAFVCPSVYTITRVEDAGNETWRIGLNMPIAVARGVAREVDAENGSFSTRTPVMKLRVNPGLFDGKIVRSLPDGEALRLKNATEEAFRLADPSAIGQFKSGGEYIVQDVGVGDRIEIISQGATGK
ncbi:MAG TPA: heparinase II/III family protein [Candidatus Brocadiia bacterium]|nr:heparinase II/III family protein [Candidatus Brocadiia bacterium]